MIYEQDVHEALQFFPEIREYNMADTDAVALIVPTVKLIPYVKRILHGVLGLPSTSHERLYRYNSLFIHFAAIEDNSDSGRFFWDSGLKGGMPLYYVREKGERLMEESLTTSMSKDIGLFSLTLPEVDVWLNMDKEYPILKAYSH